MKNYLNKLLDDLYKDKDDIDALTQIGKPRSGLIIRSRKKQNKFDQRCNSLIQRGYLTKFDGITEDGKNYLKDYHQFQELGIFAKFTKVFHQKLSTILIILSILVIILKLL